MDQSATLSCKEGSTMTREELKEKWQREILPNVMCFTEKKNSKEASIFISYWLLVSYFLVFGMTKLLPTLMGVSSARVGAIFAGLSVGAVFFVLYVQRKLNNQTVLVGGVISAVVGALIGLYVSYWLAVPIGLIYSAWLTTTDSNSDKGRNFYCTCGKVNPSTVEFCEGCGKPKTVVAANANNSSNYICVQCGASMSEKMKFCSNCGSEKTEQATNVSTRTVNVCASCGASMSEDMKFCSNCGSEKIVQAPAQASAGSAHICASCGASMSEDMKFCSNCGTSYTANAVTDNNGKENVFQVAEERAYKEDIQPAQEFGEGTNKTRDEVQLTVQEANIENPVKINDVSVEPKEGLGSDEDSSNKDVLSELVREESQVANMENINDNNDKNNAAKDKDVADGIKPAIQYCAQCGNLLSAEGNFCQYCGRAKG